MLKCNVGGKVKLTGVLTRLIGRKPAHGKQRTRTYKVGPVRGSARAGRVLTLTVKLPAAAVSALAHGAHEAASFTAVVTDAGAVHRAAASIVALKDVR